MDLYKIVRRNRTSLFAEGKYNLEYNDGEVVHALSETLGLMSFKTPEDAERFATSNFFTKNDYMILLVESLGDVIEGLEVCSFVGEKDLDVYYKSYDFLKNDYTWSDDRMIFNTSPPPGTVFCNIVMVRGEHV